MESDSDHSDENVSRFSLKDLSYGSREGTNHSRGNDSNQRSVQSSNNASNDGDTDANESKIGVQKRKTNKRIFVTDSDSDSDSNVNQSKSTNESMKESSASSKDDSEESKSSDDEEDANETDLNISSVQNRSNRVEGSYRERRGDSTNGSRQSNSYELNRSQNSDNSFRSEQNASQNSSEVIPQTDDEDIDEKELSQMHVFSPRTRRTITGRRSIMPANESEDDDIFDSEVNSSDEYKSAEAAEVDLTIDDEAGHSENSKRNRSIVVNNSMITKTPNAKRFSGIGANITTSPITSTPHRSTPDIEFSDKSNESKASDIEINSSHSDQEIKSIADDSVVLLNSSDESDLKPIANSTTVDLKGAAAFTSTPGNSKYVQPKLGFPRNPMKMTKNYVSRAFYNHEVDELTKLKLEVKENEELFTKLLSSLPDGGVNMKRRISEIKKKIDKKQERIDSYAIEEDNLDEIEIVETKNQPKTHDWRDELNEIKPRHTGQQGMATFNTQKALTLNRIEKLHKAMEKCPTETDFANQPDNLNIALMPHQLHAIKWMRWREIQRPKGGLLADDMGLGKTLTVIGLVLDAKFGKNQSLAEEENESDSENESDDDVDRGYKKSYKYEGGTLIVCPASLINQWEHEVINRVKRRKLSILMHHGTKRNESIHSLCKYDLVITTYGIISSDHKNNASIFRVHWDRVVLDEAHMIRNHSTAVSKGCCALRSTSRWGLTGTPIQNKHMDVYSMLKFLRVRPFDDLPTFRKWINPNTEAGMLRLHNILKPLLLRRTKAELQIKGELKELPKKTITIENIELTNDEANIYTSILAYSQHLFAQYMEQHQQRNGGKKIQLDADIRKRLDRMKKLGRGQEVKSAQILVLLLRLRQICDHPGLIHQMLQDECDLDDDEEEYDSMDMNIVKQMIGLKINEDEDQRNNNSSSDEENKPTNILVNTNKIYDFKNPSSKCRRVIDIVKRILRETDDKIVVVSQWTTFLGIVAEFLHRERVHYVELNGKTPIKDRNNIVVSFNNPSSPERVMMLSLVAGGVGLNLTGANNLILLDPHWNPQLESQAFDRVYRVGQTKDVNIYKLLCEKTVEKKIQSIQEAKLLLSDNVLTGSKQNGGSKLSIQDMRKLFDM